MISGINWHNSNLLDDTAWSIYQHFGGCIVMSNLGSEVANEIRRRCPDSLIIGRLWSDGGSLPDPMDAVNEWTPYIDETLLDYYQVDNEPDVNYPDTSAEEYAIWWIRVVNLLMLRYPTIKWGFPMPSVKGEQSLDYISRCKTAIVSADFIAERGYWQEEWQMESWHWGKRYQRTHLMFPNKEIHVCEYGNSSDLNWMGKAIQYAGYLKGIPPYVASAHVFIMAGGTTDWKKFWVTEEMAEVMDMAFAVGVGIKYQMDFYREEPVEDEHYLGADESFCSSNKALYIYSKAANQVARIPFEPAP